MRQEVALSESQLHLGHPPDDKRTNGRGARQPWKPLIFKLALRARLWRLKHTPPRAGTTKWVVANLPSASEKALICVDVVSLLHSIVREFATIDETRDTLYQNKRAGVSTMAITVSSSFQTVLPQIMGKSSRAGGEDSGLTLPCAAKYPRVHTRKELPVPKLVEEGLATQKASRRPSASCLY
jgi:hypothetical protein